MTALFHALIHLARWRWLGAALCALAMLWVATHATALAGATAHARIDVNASADINTLAPATELSQPKDRVGISDQNSALHVCALRSATAETYLGISNTQRETASASSYAAEGTAALAESVEIGGQAWRAFQAGEGAASGVGFGTFEAFKDVAGAAGANTQWDHIVEQTAVNAGRFGSTAIHNTGNLIWLDAAVHTEISAFYSSIQPAVTGSTSLTVRQWIGTMSYGMQQQFGREILVMFGAL